MIQGMGPSTSRRNPTSCPDATTPAQSLLQRKPRQALGLEAYIGHAPPQHPLELGRVMRGKAP